MPYISERNGTYLVRHRGPDKRERSRSFDKRRDAERYAADLTRAKGDGIYVDPRRGGITFGDLADAWMGDRVNIREGTRARDESLLRTHIRPALGPVPIGQISDEIVQDMIGRMISAGKAPSTIDKAHQLVGQVLKFAVGRRYLPGFPLSGTVTLPQKDDDTTEGKAVTYADAMRLVATVEPWWRPLVLTAAHTGARWGELVGLPISAVQFGTGEIRIRQQLSEVEGHLEISENLKTRRSRRAITVDDAVMDALREHLAFTRRVHGSGSGLLFTSENDKMLRRSNFGARVLAPAVKRAGLPDGFSFHWLRHSHVSWLLAAGEPVTEVSARVGHKTPAVTLARYSWAIPGNERSAANAMAAMSRGISRGIDPELAEVVKLPSAL